MKVLSETKDNGRVIEMTEGEWREFSKLAAAADGMAEGDFHWQFSIRDNNLSIDETKDFSGTFGAIRAFYLASFRANELQELLSSFRAYLSQK